MPSSSSRACKTDGCISACSSATRYCRNPSRNRCVGRTAELLGQRAGELAVSLGDRLGADRARADRRTDEMVGRVLAEVARSFANFRLVATREAELLRELSAAHEVTAIVPYHPGHVTDLQGLLDVGAKIWGDEAPPAANKARPRTGRQTRAKRGSPSATVTATSERRGTSGGRRTRSVLRPRRNPMPDLESSWSATGAA